ncbi:MAG: AAA family ATPase [Myxococcales bacterium]|nr:AAA family ATPase [Myxococcales bacterium]
MPPTGLHPRGAPRPTTSHAEQSLHRALATGLPSGWTAWHSLRVRSESGWEGEGDFVVAIPDRGLLVIEVKGGAIEVRDGQWLQNQRAMDRAPREQGHAFARLLVRKLEERRAKSTPAFAIATAFPDTPFSNPPRQGDLDDAVLGQQDLPYLREALEAMRERLFPSGQRPRDSRWVELLHELWGESWTPRLVLGDRARLREHELVPLDQQQLEVLDKLRQNQRLLVTGGPGTGKTLLACEMWRRLRARGARPVLMCWTKALASALRASGVDQAFTVRELAASLIAEVGIDPQDGAPPTEWSAETWELVPLYAAADALELARSRFDAVVIDEAQDLSPNDWELVRALSEGRLLWGFADDGQGFWRDRHVPKDCFGAEFELRERYRCPEPLAAFADHYRSREPTSVPPPTGVPPRFSSAPPLGPITAIDELGVVRLPSATALEDYAARELQKALAEGLQPHDLAVLSLGGQLKTELCARDRIGQVAVRRADAADAGAHVVADTFLRFKGLERPLVLVVELDRGKHRYDVRMHVALTRATVRCVVLATREEIEADARLGAAG